jgi:hypothetical protein
MQLAINIDDAVLTDFSTALGYTDQVTDNVGGLIPNPETRAQFTIKMYAEFTRKSINEYKGNNDLEVTKSKPLPVPITGTVNLNPIPISVDPIIG